MKSKPTLIVGILVVGAYLLGNSAGQPVAHQALGEPPVGVIGPRGWSYRYFPLLEAPFDPNTLTPGYVELVPGRALIHAIYDPHGVSFSVHDGPPTALDPNDLSGFAQSMIVNGGPESLIPLDVIVENGCFVSASIPVFPVNVADLTVFYRPLP